jgi:hypothetical protein
MSAQFQNIIKKTQGYFIAISASTILTTISSHPPNQQLGRDGER